MTTSQPQSDVTSSAVAGPSAAKPAPVYGKWAWGVSGGMLLFAAALFGADQVILGLAKAGWQKIQLIEGSFAPAKEALNRYQRDAPAKAIDSTGGDLPDISTDGKIRQYDPRIIQQAEQERRLPVPDTFRPGQ